MASLAVSIFRPLDWAVLGAYFAGLLASGLWLSRRRVSAEDYFLAGRRMPVWAVAFSVVASSLSAATFIGAPQQSYEGDLSYLLVTFGQALAAVLVAMVFLPAFYAHRVSTVYELLERKMGAGAKQAASATFMVGRVFASGARLYIAAIAVSLALFGDLSAGHLCAGIALLTIVSVTYSLAGGLASIIWTDVIQSAVYLLAAAGAILLLLHRIPLSLSGIVSLLEHAGPGGTSKLDAVHLGLAPGRPWLGFEPAAIYTVLTAVFGFSLLNAAAYATDQDLAQRMLTCRSAVKGSWSMIAAILITVPVTLLFLAIGLLLFVFYRSPEALGGVVPAAAPGDTRRVFLSFILQEMPEGLSGIMIAGLFAVGFTSTLSALNAMASAFVNDFYRRLRPGASGAHYLRVSRLAVAGWGTVLGAFAALCAVWQEAQGQTLIEFALSVMTFAYSGLLAVFSAAVLTRRGSSASAVAAIVIGCVVVTLLQKEVWSHWVPAAWARLRIAFPWHMPIASSIAFAVCCLGKRPAAAGPNTRDRSRRPELIAAHG